MHLITLVMAGAIIIFSLLMRRFRPSPQMSTGRVLFFILAMTFATFLLQITSAPHRMFLVVGFAVALWSAQAWRSQSRTS